MKDFFAEPSEIPDSQDVQKEIDQAVNRIKNLPDVEQPEAVAHVIKRLDAEFGEEVLEYILVIMGTRLRNGEW